MFLLVDTMRGFQTYPAYKRGDGTVVPESEVPVEPAVRKDAAKIILERGWGKSPQAVSVMTHEGDDEENGKLDEVLEIAFVDVTQEEVQSVADSDTESLRLSSAK